MLGIIFDFDGPIFDGRQAATIALEKTYDKFDSTEGRPTIPPSSIPLYDPTRLIKLAYSEFDLSRNKLAEITDYYSHELHHEEETIQINEIIKALIREMSQSGLKLVVLSARTESNLRDRLAHLGLDSFFDVIGGKDTPGTSKLDHEPVKNVARELGLDSRDLVYVGDSDIDFDVATTAGVPYYHAAWTGEPNSRAKENATAVLKLPEDLAAAFQPGHLIPPTRRSLPIELRTATDNRMFSFYAGAGVSVASGIGAWQQHYIPILRELYAGPLLADYELPEILQLLCAEPSRAKRVFDKFRDSFDIDNLKPNPYHFAMLRSGTQNIWTSNYDKLFEKCNEIEGFGRQTVKDDQELKENFRNKELIIKLNGDFFDASYRNDLNWNMVFLQQQFDLAEKTRPEIWRRFEDDYRNKSIVFVGVSFRDPVLRRIVATAASRIPRTCYSHYLLMKSAQHPAEQVRYRYYSENLKRFSIETLFFDEFSSIERFVQQVAISAKRPIVGFSGNAFLPNSASKPENVKLPKGEMTVREIEKFCSRLGQELAKRSFRVTSGHGSFVGIPAVEAAFQEKANCARFYLRTTGRSRYSRAAPVIIVRGDSLDDMRDRFIPELSLLVAIGGQRYKEPKPGVITEIEIAIRHSIPVLLIPQSGGDVTEYVSQFGDELKTKYRDPALAQSIAHANDKISKMPAHKLVPFAAEDLPTLIEDVVAIAFGAPLGSPGGAAGTEVW